MYTLSFEPYVPWLIIIEMVVSTADLPVVLKDVETLSLQPISSFQLIDPPFREPLASSYC
jgi:hypothetical protein